MIFRRTSGLLRSDRFAITFISSISSVAKEEHLVDIAHEALLGLAEPFLQPLEEGALLFTVSEHDSLPFVETTCINVWMYRITQDSLSSPKK